MNIYSYLHRFGYITNFEPMINFLLTCWQKGLSLLTFVLILLFYFYWTFLSMPTWHFWFSSWTLKIRTPQESKLRTSWPCKLQPFRNEDRTAKLTSCMSIGRLKESVLHDSIVPSPYLRKSGTLCPCRHFREAPVISISKLLNARLHLFLYIL